MTSPLAGKVRMRCDVCMRRYYYVGRLAASLELRPWWYRETTPAHAIALPPGALVCDRCAQSNDAVRQVNPLPLQKPGRAVRTTRRRKLQLLIGETLSSPEAERLRSAAKELRSIGDAFVESGRMRGTHDRLNVLADELVEMSQAAEIADRIAAELEAKRDGAA